MPQYCKFPDCKKYASYGFPDKKGQTRLRCKEHKEDGMVTGHKTDSRVCQHEDHKGEEKIPRASFNFPEEKKGKYCSQHKEDGMVNVNSKMCVSCGEKVASYGSEKKATHCSDCATPDMTDVVSKLCTTDGCKKNACYGLSGERPTKCSEHKSSDMVDVKNKKCEKCIELKCAKPVQASYGLVKNKPTHCSKHKSSEMVNVRK